MKDNKFKDTWLTRKKVLNEKTYTEYLQSKEWKSIKFKAKKRRFYNKCLKCGTKKNIELHHRTYKWIGTKNAMRDIVPLCNKCHNKVHEIAKSKNVSVRIATNAFIQDYYQSLEHVKAKKKNKKPKKKKINTPPRIMRKSEYLKRKELLTNENQ